MSSWQQILHSTGTGLVIWEKLEALRLHMSSYSRAMHVLQEMNAVRRKDRFACRIHYAVRRGQNYV